MKSRHVLIISSIFWSSFASAQAANAFLTGNCIFQKCDNAANSSESSFCAGYVAGITDALQRSRTVCLPKHVTVRQARDIIIKYLRNHPEERHYSAASEIALALKQAFPCDQ
jgi:Rap1a immunity proteins